MTKLILILTLSVIAGFPWDDDFPMPPPDDGECPWWVCEPDPCQLYWCV